MRFSLRKVLLGLIALVVIGGFFSGLNFQNAGPEADPRMAQEGSPDTGPVTLVVDFGPESGLEPIIRRVESFGGTGWELFAAAGVSVEGTAEFPTGFICRIAEHPEREKQDCLDTPQFSEGSWAYFVTNSKLGSGWLLSGAGASTHQPECGGYEGWLWVAPGQSSGQKLPSVEARPESCKG
ncbi:MAG: hypothetical protein RLZZ90_378 [Actinomycetota bacterium]